MPSDAEQPSLEGAPAVGNILGFGLQLRERRALLTLERRSLVPGVRLSGYEAEIPGIKFPLRVPFHVAGFRHRRCRSLRFALSIELGVIERWLTTQLIGQTIDGVTVEHVDIDVRARTAHEVSPYVWIELRGREPTRGFAWLGVALQLVGQARFLAFRPFRIWAMGAFRERSGVLWSQLIANLSGRGLHREREHVVVDPGAIALHAPFVASGWKAPDLQAVNLVSLTLETRSLEVVFDTNQPSHEHITVPVQCPRLVDDSIGAGLDRLRLELERKVDRSLLDALASIGDRLAYHHSAHAACMHWRMTLSRFIDERHALASATQWLTLRPHETRASRQVFELLARSGAHTKIARLLTSQLQMPQSPRRRATLELGLCEILAAKLDDASTACDVLEPLIDRCRADSDLSDLLPTGLATLAYTSVLAGPNKSATSQALDEALELTEDPSTRARMRARVANALVSAGQVTKALALLTRACADDPGDDELLDATIDLSLQVGEHHSAIALLEIRLRRAAEHEREPVHRRLIEALLHDDSLESKQHALAELRRLLAKHGGRADDLRRMAELERELGRPEEAAERLAELARKTNDPDVERRLHIERARLLLAAQQRQAAWQVIEPVFADSGWPLEDELAELAFELAPAHARARVLERIAVAGHGQRRARALLERADVGARRQDRLADLREAATLLEDPRPALRGIADIVGSEDPAAWIALAVACDTGGDAQGATEASIRAAQCLLAAQRADEAIAWFERAASVLLEQPELRLAFADALERCGRTDAALEQLTLLLDVQRERIGLSPGALELRCARLCLRANRHDKAVELLQSVFVQLPAGSQERHECASVLVDVLTDLDRNEQAAQVALRAAEAGEDKQRAYWLARAATLGEPARKLELLRAATQLAPDDGPLATELERALESAGLDQELEQHLRARLAVIPLEPSLEAELLERLLHLLDVRTTSDGGMALQDSAGWIVLLQRRIELDGNNSAHTRRLAELLDASGRETDALRCWERVEEHAEAPTSVPMGVRIRLARSAAEHGQHERARERLRTLVDEDHIESEQLEAVVRIAHVLDDVALVVSATQRLAQLAQTAPQKAFHLLELVRALHRAGHRPRALEHITHAREHIESGSALHLELAETWLTIALDQRDVPTLWDQQQEALARTQLREVLGRDLPTSDLRAEALLIARLGRSDEAIRLIEHGLADHPSDALLVSSLEQLCNGDAALASSFMDRPTSAAYLLSHARKHADDAAACNMAIEPLEKRSQWPEVLHILELRIERTDNDPERVSLLKRLAHVCGDVLGDPDSASVHLDRALEIAPTDPDVLLALLEHHYAQADLPRSIELTTRVMDHVPMGDPAFCALAHRAADAALARGEQELASDLLKRVLTRDPADARTRARIAELEAMNLDPEHRVRLFANIAHRQTGRARVEALEERARLLVDPLARIDEAIEDLRNVVDEAPERHTSRALLRELLERRSRWSDLVNLLEEEFPRLPGNERAATLRKIADIYRNHLFDLPRAEQALRLALESIDPERATADIVNEMHQELAMCLERQGRYLDLAKHLERLVENELPHDGESPRSVVVEWLIELARVYRDYLDDEPKAARMYERLERMGQLPDEGLAALARWYRSQHRHDDLVRILVQRSQELGLAHKLERKAEVDTRIAELLEGPLRKPLEAARFYLEAYLCDPTENAPAGAKARLLLASTDAILNVRDRLVTRIASLENDRKPALLVLLADLLSPHDEHEQEAERCYRDALWLDADNALAYEGLGRLLARQGRLDDAADPLIISAQSEDIEPARAAENAAIAGRVLFELGRSQDAERVLKRALGRAPDAQRALLELARLYHRLKRADDEAETLDDLSRLPLSSMLRAEVAYRRALLLEHGYAHDPLSEAAERARAYLLEAVSSDAGHVAARQLLLSLASSRSEWSIVAHMHYLSIRELAPGPQRAIVHMDLAETYLERLNDIESAMRNLESALQQAASDVVVANRATRLSERLPNPRVAAERFEQIAGAIDNELDNAARARLWLIAAELRIREDDLDAAEAASRRVLALDHPPVDATQAAARNLEMLGNKDRKLQRQCSGLLRLLDVEEQEIERLHILGRLREIGRVLGDKQLVEDTSRQQLVLAHKLTDADSDRDAAVTALREVYAERGDYGEIVNLYEGLAEQASDPEQAATILTDAARFAWHDMHDAVLAVGILRRALSHGPGFRLAAELLGEIAGAEAKPELDRTIVDELGSLPIAVRSPSVGLRVAESARRLGRLELSAQALREVLAGQLLASQRIQALGYLDTILAQLGDVQARIAVLDELRIHLLQHAPERVAEIALELARLQLQLGFSNAASRVIAETLERAPDHKPMLRLRAELLEQAEEFGAVAQTYELLARFSSDDKDRSAWLSRAARVVIAHSDAIPGSFATARDLLERALAAFPLAIEPRIQLLPLAFAEGRWQEVLDLAKQLRDSSGDGHEVLLLASMTEAFMHGLRTTAQALGARHDTGARQRILWPAISRVLSEIAVRGPLPRLDSVLAAATFACDGVEPLLYELQQWTAGRPLQAGLALGLARLHEAVGHADMARHLYQMAAYIEPSGPVRALTARLPEPDVPAEPLSELSWIPMELRGLLRSVFIQLGDMLAGIRGHGGEIVTPMDTRERTIVATTDRIVAPWRRLLGLALPVALTHDAVLGEVGVRNYGPPSVLVGARALTLPPPELVFRLARACGAIALGLAAAMDTHPVPLRALLRAIGRMAHPPTSDICADSSAIIDALADRGGYDTKLSHDVRTILAHELGHWLARDETIGQLAMAMDRATLLFGTRLSGALDGALLALARDAGMLGHEHSSTHPLAVLHTDPALWLLRSLSVFG